jgi:hypothetical protein
MRNTHVTARSSTDIVNVLREDHAALRELATAVVDGTTDAGADFLKWSDLVVRHEIAEELVVYPVLLAFRGGAAVVDSRLEDQTRMEKLLVAVERQVPGTAGFEEGASRLVRDHLTHLGMEDAQVIPILSTRLGRHRKAELGRRFRQVAQVSPLHRLPEGSRAPLGRTVVDRSAALSVWLRDVAVSSGLAG